MNTIDSTKGGLGVALAILGCILGLAGSWAGLTAKNSQADTRAKLEGLENLVGSLSTENQNLSMKVQGLSDQTQQTQQALTDIAARLPAPKKATTETTGTAKNGDDGKTEATAKPPVAEGDYQVKSGDTLDKIARAHNTSVAALQKANPGLDAKHLKIGKTIKIR